MKKSAIFGLILAVFSIVNVSAFRLLNDTNKPVKAFLWSGDMTGGVEFEYVTISPGEIKRVLGSGSVLQIVFYEGGKRRMVEFDAKKSSSVIRAFENSESIFQLIENLNPKDFAVAGGIQLRFVSEFTALLRKVKARE